MYKIISTSAYDDPTVTEKLIAEFQNEMLACVAAVRFNDLNRDPALFYEVANQDYKLSEGLV